MATTFRIVPANVGAFGNKSLKWALVGFSGTAWLSLPFFTYAEAQAAARERGWVVTR